MIYLVAVVSLVIGFAVAWWLRPYAERRTRSLIDVAAVELDRVRSEHAACAPTIRALHLHIAELEARLAMSPAPRSLRRPMVEEEPEVRLAIDLRKDPDDLTRIRGIGPKIAATLNSIGISSYEQLAFLDDEGVERIAAALGHFPDRIKRDDWVGSARRLLDQRATGATAP